jgi:hypothetical protein
LTKYFLTSPAPYLARNCSTIFRTFVASVTEVGEQHRDELPFFENPHRLHPHSFDAPEEASQPAR